MSIGSDNGLASFRRQVITWSNVDPVHWCIYAALGRDELTHWGQVMHKCISKQTIIGHCTNAVIWLNEILGTNFIKILHEIYTFPFMKKHLKISVSKWLTFCLGLNVLRWILACSTPWGLGSQGDTFDTGMCPPPGLTDNGSHTQEWRHGSDTLKGCPMNMAWWEKAGENATKIGLEKGVVNFISAHFRDSNSLNMAKLIQPIWPLPTKKQFI